MSILRQLCLTKLPKWFVQNLIYICLNQSRYLFKFLNVFVNIQKCILWGGSDGIKCVHIAASVAESSFSLFRQLFAVNSIILESSSYPMRCTLLCIFVSTSSPLSLASTPKQTAKIRLSFFFLSERWTWREKEKLWSTYRRSYALSHTQLNG